MAHEITAGDQQAVSYNKDDLGRPVILNVQLHQRLLQTGGVKASTLESARCALRKIQHRKAGQLLAKKAVDEA